MKHLVLLVALGACAEDPEPLDPGDVPVEPTVCPERCDDRDPCTDDFCESATSICRFLPRNVLDACRSDAHCDDGLACTTDHCVVDDCGLERCAHTPVPECAPCVEFDDCPMPSDACVSAFCRDGFCERAENSNCDLGCVAGLAVEPPKLTMDAVVTTDDCGCDCETDPYVGRWVVEGGTCHAYCNDDGPFVRVCTPVPSTALMHIVGEVIDDETLVPESWCVSVFTLDFVVLWRGTLTLDGDPHTLHFLVAGSSLALNDRDCAECRLAPDVRMLQFALPDERIPLRADGRFLLDGKPRTATMVLYPTPTGFVGNLHSTTSVPDGPFSGTITLDIDQTPP